MKPADFVPCTREVQIADGIVYRPIRSWHSGTYAGEQRDIVDGDRSGCAWRDRDGLMVTMIPRSVTHRAYWHRKDPSRWVSAFLSYPGAMGACSSYFWEANIPSDGDSITRYVDEAEMEAAIVAFLTSDGTA